MEPNHKPELDICTEMHRIVDAIFGVTEPEESLRLREQLKLLIELHEVRKGTKAPSRIINGPPAAYMGGINVPGAGNVFGQDFAREFAREIVRAQQTFNQELRAQRHPHQRTLPNLGNVNMTGVTTTEVAQHAR